MRIARPVQERFWRHVDPDLDAESCWEWRAKIERNGYGRIREGGAGSRSVGAHRVAYEIAFGSIPEGLTIDHLCRNRSCVNPNHLEAVTIRENLLRGTSPVSRNAVKTHCKYGHPLEGENLYVYPDGIERMCRTCGRRRVLEYQERQRKRACIDYQMDGML